jgi:serine/threonine protein phosphatase 1
MNVQLGRDGRGEHVNQALPQFPPTAARAPRDLPQGWRVYAIGDVHGRLDLLHQVICAIEEDLIHYPCRVHLRVFLGDYIDRGAESREVVDTLIELARLRPTVCLAGNHELMALKWMTEPQLQEDWLRLGGRETLRSYGVNPVRKGGRPAPAEEVAIAFASALGAHAKFLSALPTTFAIGDYFFVHAGVRPHVPLCWQAVEDLVQIREPFLSFEGEFGRMVVHGHTPVAEADIRPNRINLDTGAYHSSRLTCMVFEKESLRIL